MLETVNAKVFDEKDETEAWTFVDPTFNPVINLCVYSMDINLSDTDATEVSDEERLAPWLLVSVLEELSLRRPVTTTYQEKYSDNEEKRSETYAWPLKNTSTMNSFQRG